MYECIDDEQTMYSFMKHLETIYDPNYNFEAERKKNKTEYHKILEETSIPTTWAFFQELIVNNEYVMYFDDDDTITIKPKTLLTMLNKYCKENKVGSNETSSSLKRKMRRVDKDSYKRIETAYHFILSKASIELYLKSNNCWSD